jgi:hypothetical protein
VGGRTVAEAKQAMPYAEFVRHLAYYQMAPWGDDWEQSATQSWAAVSPHVKRKVTPADFRPKRHEKPQTADEIFGVVKQLALDAEARRKARGSGK